MTHDLVIVGGGPAGLATGIIAAERGLDAVVLDRREPPLDKPCGEGAMPGAVAALRAMRVTVPADGRTPFVGVRYLDAETVAEGRFPGGPGWGIRRTALVAGMIERARAVGVALRWGSAVERWRRIGDGVEVATTGGVARGRLVVGADGLRSPIRAAAGLERRARGRRRFGMRRHYRIAPWSPFVEVYWTDGAEAYVTPAGPRRVGVALLWDGDGARYDALLARFPRLTGRLDGAPFDDESELAGAGPLRRRAARRFADGVALVGDAAGYVDAITGEGLTVAFESARALVDVVARGAPLAAYETAYRRLSRTYYVLTALMVWVAAHPRLRRRVIAALARRPELFDRMLAINAGERPLSSLGVGGVVQLLHGVLR